MTIFSRNYALLLLAVGVLLGLAGVRAQEQPDPAEPPPLVAFVDDQTIASAQVSDPGADGLGRFADIVRSLGARTITVSLEAPLSPEIDLLVVVGPRRGLSTTATARIWQHIQRGGHLLMAVDPNGPERINTLRSRDGLNDLLRDIYGLAADDPLLAYTWLTRATINESLNSWSLVRPDDYAAHPVTDPLLAYDLPVYTWLARSVNVYGLDLNANADALLYTEDGFGETNSRLFRDANERIELNIGSDAQGRLLVGGLGTNLDSGARMVLLGDSHMLLNIFGLTRRITDQTQPLYPGNQILAQRISAWLLDLPTDQYPPLPDGFTWLALDGRAEDWDGRITAEVTDISLDAAPLTHDVQRVLGFANDQYVYVMIQTLQPPEAAPLVTLTINDGQAPIQIDATEATVTRRPALDFEATGEQIGDAALAADTVIEMRLPRRLFGPSLAIFDLCLIYDPEAPDCIETTLTPVVVDEVDPAPVRLFNAPMAITRTTSVVNLRSGPGTDTTIIESVGAFTPFNALGRNAEADWVQVQNGRYVGWMAAFLLGLNTDIQGLPITDGSAPADAPSTPQTAPATATPTPQAANLFATNTPSAPLSVPEPDSLSSESVGDN